MQEVNCLKNYKVFINLNCNKQITLTASSVIISSDKAYILAKEHKLILKYERELNSFVLKWYDDYYKVKSHNIPIPISL